MEEQIDILNPDGSPAGYSCGRTEVHAKGLWHRTVHIWAFDGRGRVLFQLRSHLKENNPNGSQNAAIRELGEELGLTKKIEDLEYLFESTHESVLNGGTYFDNEYYDVYKITLTDEDAAHLVPQPGEVDDFVWMTVGEFLELQVAHPEKFVSHPKDYNWLASIAKL